MPVYIWFQAAGGLYRGQGKPRGQSHYRYVGKRVRLLTLAEREYKLKATEKLNTLSREDGLLELENRGRGEDNRKTIAASFRTSIRQHWNRLRQRIWIAGEFEMASSNLFPAAFQDQ